MKHPKAAGQHVNHERWLVSYADFITLLFAFFVVLYASAEMDKKKIAQLSAAIEGGFQQMGAFAKDQPAAPPVGPDAQKNAEPASSLTSLPPRLEAGPGGVVDAYALQRELEKVLGAEIREHEIEMRVTPEGLVLSLREVGFFDSGQATMLPSALPKLARIAKVLNAHGFDIRVEGHTDNVPIHNAAFHSNWELSTARATQVVSLLVESYDLDPLRVSAAGYGQYHPVASNETAQGRKMNRRVDIVITSGGGKRAEVRTAAPVDGSQPGTNTSPGG
ncbi:MAG TPA: flagellar motor protein MotB [Candidatus Angelobacter sp.]|nr:flagellar motor protein MotB [Candidatus Angelobacter sp.]